MKLEKIFFINLQKDRERRVRLERSARKYFAGIPCERIEAVAPKDLPEYEGVLKDRLSHRLKPVAGEYPLPGAVCCILSHHLALRMVRDEWQQNGSADSVYLVLEDDCVFDATVYPKIVECMSASVPEDWTIAKHSLGQFDPEDRINDSFFHVSNNTHQAWDYYWGAHFLLYRGEAVDTIIDIVDTAPIHDFDGWVKAHLPGVYSFANNLRIRQSNLGGSNTNPEFSGPQYEDRKETFGILAILEGIRRWFGKA